MYGQVWIHERPATAWNHVLFHGKFDDFNHPAIEEMLWISDSQYTKQQMIAAEALLLNSLQFKLHKATVPNIAFQLLALLSLPEKETKSTLRLCEFVCSLHYMHPFATINEDFFSSSSRVEFAAGILRYAIICENGKGRELLENGKGWSPFLAIASKVDYGPVLRSCTFAPPICTETGLERFFPSLAMK